MADDREHRIRERAYRLWEDEGRPEGRAEHHWRQASQDAGDEMFDQPGMDRPQERRGALDGGLLAPGGLVAAGPAGTGVAGLGLAAEDEEEIARQQQG